MNKNIEIVKVGKEDYPTNCYIIYDQNKKAVVIDPGFDANKIIKHIEKSNLKVEKIIITHSHADHMGALEELQKYTNSKVFVHKADKDGIFDLSRAYFEYLDIPMQNIDKSQIIELEEGDNIECGNIKLEVIHTPGHTSGSMCLFEEELNALFTGDTIFYNCYGRCDLISGSVEDMGKSINKLFDRFENVVIYPGHEEITNIDNVKRRIRLLYKIKTGN